MSEIRLNLQQERAVKHAGGPLLIIAGAGTGKTTVITERIKWLIQNQSVKPENILALTFTEKAAMEMEQRVDIVLPLGYNRTWIMTFHGFCERVLRQDASQIGLDPGFSILTEADAQLFIKKNLAEFGLNYYRPRSNPTKFIGGLVKHFSRLKDEDISPDDYLAWAQKPHAEEIPASKSTSGQVIEVSDGEKYLELARVYKKYEELKVKNSVMDFADLITNTLRLFRERPNVLKSYQKQFPYLLLDEFQDTNYAQNHMAIMLAHGEADLAANITAVADDDQSIYRWRGAAVYNVLDFKKHFPDAEIITLTQNYRSDQRILDQSYQLVQNNNPDRLEVRAQIDKRLVSELPAEKNWPKPLQLIWADKVEGEVDQVVEQIKLMVKENPLEGPKDTFVKDNASGSSDPDESAEGPLRYSDIAILIRANNQADPFTQGLSQAGIPFQFLGPGKLFRQPEIRELVAYLKFLTNFADNQLLYKVLSMAAFGLSGRDLGWIISQAKLINLSLFEMIEMFLTNIETYQHQMESETVVRLNQFVEMVHRHLTRINKSGPGEILYYFLQDTGLLKNMQDPQSEYQVRVVENISAFFNMIKAYEVNNPESNLFDFVEYIDFLIQTGESPRAMETDWTQQDAVNILTVHSSKGLEFKVVFIVNLVDLRFPSMDRSDQIPVPEALVREPMPKIDPHIGEERRLFYVAMTRAKNKLYLTGAKFYHEGKRAKKLSPFVMEALGDPLEPYLLGQESVAQPRLFDLSKFAPVVEEPVLTPAVKRSYKVNYLSYSHTETFRTCPLHYKLDYILKVPKLPSAPLTFGTAIHTTLQNVYGLIMTEQLPKELDPVLEQAMQLYKKNWSPVGFESKDQEREYRDQGEKILTNFFTADLGREFKVLKLEEEFNFSLSNDLRIGGRIDRIDELSDGRFEIIDYKTGQVPEIKELEKGSKGLQLCIYALAATHPQVLGLKLDQLVLSFYYLEENKKISIEKTAADLDKAQEEILKIRDEIEQSDFTCNNSFFCQRGCEYALFCEK
jgi:DNA helicase-2/ATP-dependent DNA helicase PcrA